MPQKNYIKTDGNNNIVLQDVNGQNININDISSIKKAFENSKPAYLKELYEQIDQKYNQLTDANKKQTEQIVALLQTELKNKGVEIKESKNILTGTISGVGGNVQLGDTYNSNPIDELRGRIMTYLNRDNLPSDYKTKLNELAEQATLKNNYPYPKLLSEFTKIEENIKNISKDIRKYVIWLNRREQKKQYLNKIKRQDFPFIFAISGQYDDKVDYATEMLQEYHINDILRVKNADTVYKNRIKQSVSIDDKKSAETEFDSIIREILDIGLFEAETNGLPDLLNQEYGDRHIIIVCPVAKWTKNGIEQFTKLWNKIERKPEKPLILILEFENKNSNELTKTFGNLSKEYPALHLLPKLEKVSEQEISDFYKIKIKTIGKSYGDIFYEDSLEPKDAPIFFKEAIQKLKLKI